MFEVLNVRKDYGDGAVLAAVSFKLAGGQKAGLVGRNGSGKSTLLKIAAGLLECDSGSIHRFGNMKVGYLPQAIDEEDACTVGDVLAPGFHQAIQQMRSCEAEMEARKGDADVLEAYSAAVESFEEAGGYRTEARMETVLAGLGMSGIALERPLTTLSGGQKTRLALARVLLVDADILLLDEPTNNLDRQALAWLERELLEYKGCCLLVSHDRHLLDRVTSKTLELDATTGKVTEYGGNYTWYQKRKSEDRARQSREYEEQQNRIRQLKQNIIDHKQKALATENKTVHDFYRGRSKKVAATAKARESRLEKLLADEGRIEKPRQQEAMRLCLAGNTMHGVRLIEVTDCRVERSSKTILEKLDLDILGGKRIAITGANGSGKTSLLELIVGNLRSETGAVRTRAGLTIGYLPQHQEILDPQSSVLQYFLSKLPHANELLDEGAARTFLHRFLFSRDEVFKKVRQLSRGERTKLILATFMASSPDLLVLDEPTNHLDLLTLECLEQALVLFQGALLVVSHDRYFLDKIKPEMIWKLEERRVIQTYAEATLW